MIKLSGFYVKREGINSPFFIVDKLILLDDELNKEHYLIDTGCDYDLAISEIFISQKTKEMLIVSKMVTREVDKNGELVSLTTKSKLGEVIINKKYRKKVEVSIRYDSGFQHGEKIIGINIINEFLTTLDPFKKKITLVR